MPVYEYECSQCEKIHEVQQKISDDPLRVCPDCGGEVKKLISMSSFQLKGGGWYADGYTGPSNGKGKNGDSKKSETGSSKPACGADSPCKSCPAQAAS